jgi:hypothetical protein
MRRNERPSLFSLILPSSLGGKLVSGSKAWVVNSTFLNCHRPPIDENQTELASSIPGQLSEPTEKRKGDAG